MSPINSLTEQTRYKTTVKRSFLAVVLACGLTSCFAFATTTDIVALFIGVVATAVAKMLLGAADIVINPLLEITSMTTEEIEAYIPGLGNSDPNGVGNFFSSAIGIIAYTIAGVLLCCHIISYLVALANDERMESIPKLIWNGMFGIVLTIAGKNLLSLLFNEIISPLSKALVEGMQSAGGMSFTFEGKANDIVQLGDITAAFDITKLGTLLVVLVMLLLIWWNILKLVLECAQRYIICVVTINLSPLAFATATTEQTKQTATNWLKMFWSQCVLLVLNIWVVGVARTALNNGMIGSSTTELVTWALITYAFLKIAQKLDDMMQTAGLNVTRMNGLDPLNEAQGVIKSLTGIGAAVNTAFGYGKGAFDTLRGKVSEGKNPALTETDLNRAEADFDKTDVQRKNDLNKGSINAASYDDDAHKKAMENVLKTEGTLKDGEKVEGVKIGDNGALHATAVKRDERGHIMSSREIKATNTGDGLGLTPADTDASSLKVTNGGKSAILTNEQGTFRLDAQGKNSLGENVWKATQIADGDGNKVQGVVPEEDATQKFTVDADWDDDKQNKKDGNAASAAAFFTDGHEENASIMDDMSMRTANDINEKKENDEAEKEAFADKFGMTDSARVADMMDTDSAVDYNSDNAKKAMEDYIMQNKDQNPGLAPFAKALENGGHITSMSMADGSNPAVPEGALQFEIAHSKSSDDKNPDITAGAISNPATPAPVSAEKPPLQNAQPEERPATKQETSKEHIEQPAPQNAEAPIAGVEPDEAPALRNSEAPLANNDNAGATGKESAVLADEPLDNPVDAKGTVQNDAEQPLNDNAPPKENEHPKVEPHETAGPDETKIPATKQNGVVPETAQGQNAVLPNNALNQPAVNAAAKQVENTADSTPIAASAQSSAAAPTANPTIDTAPTPDTANNGTTQTNHNPVGNATVQQESGAAPATAATTQTATAGIGTVQSTPVTSQTKPSVETSSGTTTTPAPNIAAKDGSSQSADVTNTAAAQTGEGQGIHASTVNTPIAAPAAPMANATSEMQKPDTTGAANAAPIDAETPKRTSNEDAVPEIQSQPTQPAADNPTNANSGTTTITVESANTNADADCAAEGSDTAGGTQAFDDKPENGSSFDEPGAPATTSSGDTITSSDSDNSDANGPDSANMPNNSSDDSDKKPDNNPGDEADKQTDDSSDDQDDDNIDAIARKIDKAPIADGTGFYGESAGNSFKKDEAEADTDEDTSHTPHTDEPEVQDAPAERSNRTTETVPETGQEQAQSDTAAQRENEQEQSETVPVKSVPQGIVLSDTSVNKLSNTSGTIRSASAGVFKLSREELDEDTGNTVWRATLKQDADGNPVANDGTNTFTFERAAKWNPQTRSYQPESFDSVAKEVRTAVDFHEISESANQPHESRSLAANQQVRSESSSTRPNKSDRSNETHEFRPYTNDPRMFEKMPMTAKSASGRNHGKRKLSDFQKRAKRMSEMPGFKTKK